MAAASMGNTPMGSRNRRYRKRRPLPALILFVVLGLIATVVWLKVLGGSTAPSAITCDKPATQAVPPKPGQAPATALGQVLASNALDHTAPAAPNQMVIHVINGSVIRGAAAQVSAALRQFGFTQVADPANDPLYGQTLNCRAQIRFGQQGTSAARTLSLVEPCAELVKDNRKDASVDLAIGAQFDDLRPNSEARDVLQQLADWSAQHPEAQGGLQANEASGPKLDAELLTAARRAHC